MRPYFAIGSTCFFVGPFPGFVELVGIATANICDRIDKITIDEGSDTTLYDSPDTERPVGFDKKIDDPDLPPMAERGTAVFAEAVQLVADAVGIELDEIKCVSEYAQTTEDLPMASWTIKAGHVAGVYASWQGIANGRTVIDINVRWKKGQTLDPDWQLDGDGWKITIDGRPTVNMQVGFLPPPDMIENAKTLEDFFVLGHIISPARVVGESGGQIERDRVRSDVVDQHRAAIRARGRVGGYVLCRSFNDQFVAGRGLATVASYLPTAPTWIAESTDASPRVLNL